MKANLFALLVLALFVLSACTSQSTNPSANDNVVTGKSVDTSGASQDALESNDCNVAVKALEDELNSLKEQLSTAESEFVKGVRRLDNNPDPAEEARINAIGDQLPELRKLIQNLYAALEEKKASCN